MDKETYRDECVKLVNRLGKYLRRSDGIGLRFAVKDNGILYEGFKETRDSVLALTEDTSIVKPFQYICPDGCTFVATSWVGLTHDFKCPLCGKLISVSTSKPSSPWPLCVDFGAWYLRFHDGLDFKSRDFNNTSYSFTGTDMDRLFVAWAEHRGIDLDVTQDSMLDLTSEQVSTLKAIRRVLDAAKGASG